VQLRPVFRIATRERCQGKTKSWRGEVHAA
jgi:hypothetical protein